MKPQPTWPIERLLPHALNGEQISGGVWLVPFSACEVDTGGVPTRQTRSMQLCVGAESDAVGCGIKRVLATAATRD